MKRFIAPSFVLLLALAIAIVTPTLLLTHASSATQQIRSTTPVATPTPSPTPKPVLSVQGPPPPVTAAAVYLIDMDTNHVLDDMNSTTPLPMASTTKIMTALIAIQAGTLSDPVPIQQDAVDEYQLHDGSNAQLQVGETYSLQELLYALLLPSGDDAAVAIADHMAGSVDNFVHIMNLFASRHHLVQTHYADPDGLNWRNSPDHYTTAADLTQLAQYAMSLPLFAQIVQTQTYSVPATSQHAAHNWNNTDTLLATYQGMIGIKTGHTDAAGYCLVFAAMHNGHYLLGTILGSPDETQRNEDVSKLLDWGFSLPLLPPTPTE